MFYLNLDFIVCWALVLLILCNFFSKIALHVFSELCMQSFSVIDLYRIACEVCMNFKQSTDAFLPNARFNFVPFAYG